MILLQQVRDMTKLKPTIRPPNNTHIQRDSSRAQKQLARLVALMDNPLTSPEVSDVSRPKRKERVVKIVVGVDI